MNLKHWVLKSIPLRNLLWEWANVRSLYFIDEEQEIPVHIFRNIYRTRSMMPGGFFLGDVKEIRLGIICTSNEKIISENLVQDYIVELESFLKNCGRNSDEYFLSKLPFSSFFLKKNLKPLFCIFWKPEKPLWERILSGEENFNIQELYSTEKSLRDAKESFYSVQSQPLSRSLKEDSKYLFKKLIFHSNHNIYKYFIKKSQDRYVVLMVSASREFFSLEFLRDLIEFYVYSERPVLKLEEYLHWYPFENKTIILIELKSDGFWKGIFYNATAIFYRNQKEKIYPLPDYKKQKKYIRLSRFDSHDELILIPSLHSLSVSRTGKKEKLYKELKNFKIGKALSIMYQ